jgi:hypothetical protein
MHAYEQSMKEFIIGVLIRVIMDLCAKFRTTKQVLRISAFALLLIITYLSIPFGYENN